jgi:hypothetical protein
MALLKSKPTPTLEARIREIREAADKFIDEKTEALKAETPDLPITVIRGLLTNRTFGCPCQAALNILENEI